MSEEEIIDILQNIICDEVIGTYCIKIQEEIDCSENCKDDDCYLIKAIDGIIDLYKNLKAIEQEHQKINGELREEIKQLKEELLKENNLNKPEKPQYKHMSDKPYLKV